MGCFKKDCDDSNLNIVYYQLNAPKIAYGGLQSIYTQTLSLTKDVLKTVPLTAELPKYKVSYSSNTIEIDITGTYEITYVFLAKSSVASLVTSTVVGNGVPLSSTSMGRNLAADQEAIFTGTSLVKLTKGDVLELQVYANQTTTLTLPDGLNAEIIVKKISKN